MDREAHTLLVYIYFLMNTKLNKDNMINNNTKTKLRKHSKIKRRNIQTHAWKKEGEWNLDKLFPSTE